MGQHLIIYSNRQTQTCLTNMETLNGKTSSSPAYCHAPYPGLYWVYEAGFHFFKLSLTFFAPLSKMWSMSSSVISLSFEANTCVAPCLIICSISSFPSLFRFWSTSLPAEESSGGQKLGADMMEGAIQDFSAPDICTWNLQPFCLAKEIPNEENPQGKIRESKQGRAMHHSHPLH